MKIQILFALLLTLGLSACGSANDSTDKNAEMENTDANYGLALYTLRDTLAENPKGVLKAVADIGYKNIESAGYQDGQFYGMEPTEFKAYLDEIGLTPLSSHNSSITLDNAEQIAKDVKAAGFKYLVIPIPPMGYFTVDRETRKMGMSGDIEKVTNTINTIAEIVTAQGLECLYHNHDFEFLENENGIVPMDYFIENSDPKFLNFQLDLYWATKAGTDPLDYFAKAPGRFKAWHVKDMDEEGRFAPVGKGGIDFDRILAEKEVAGMEAYFVEQDATFNHKPMEAIKISLEGLKEIGFD
ncbi:MAG TPA: sugar phosphate isomerase/epimerase [Saprospiraceae bacterium]|nr:sugar phosphate isomerase/epimerase [Saprospiraceae bacterium]